MKTAASQRRRRLGRILADNRGVSAIEFALLSPVVIILTLATFELALDMIVDATVQMAAESASRTGLTTTAPATGTRADQAKSIVMSMLGRWQTIGATVSITTWNYGNYDNIGTPNYQLNMGGFGDVVAYQISVTLPRGFTGIYRFFGVTLPLTFQRNYLVQNEK